MESRCEDLGAGGNTGSNADVRAYVMWETNSPVTSYSLRALLLNRL